MEIHRETLGERDRDTKIENGGIQVESWGGEEERKKEITID